MKASKLVALAFAVLGFGAAPAVAAPIDYFLNVPLFSADPAGAAPDLTLRGTLSYDGDEAMTGTGIFTIGNNPSETFSGFAFLMNLGTKAAPSTGVLFNGDGASGSSLYMSFITGMADAVSGTVNYCTAGGCSLFNTVGPGLNPAGTSPIQIPTPPVGLPIGGVSPVPLPPAVTLFGGALMMLAVGVAARRTALRPRTVKA